MATNIKDIRKGIIKGVLFPAFCQFHVSYDTQPVLSYQQSSGTKRHCVLAIGIDNAHYLSQLFHTVYVAHQY